jgi:Flp pilus assembly protein TadD
MPTQKALAFTIIATVLSGVISSRMCLAQMPAQNPGQPQSNALTVIIRVRDAAGGFTLTSPTVVLTGEAQGGKVYAGTPIQNEDQWAFVVPGVGSYTVEVSAPGYKTERRSVSVTVNETPEIEVALEAQDSPGKARGASILTPKAREEVQKGKLALSNKRFEEAKLHLEKALQLAPTSSEVNYLVGLFHYYTGNGQTASEYLQKAVSLDRNNGPALLALGEIYYREKDYKRAAETLEQGLQEQPSSWRAQAVLGSSYYQQGAYEKGREHAQIAMDVGKEEASSTGFLLAKCLAALGRKKEAIEALQTFLKSQPPPSMASSAEAMLKELQGAQ